MSYNVAEEVMPNAGALVESLRDFGYTLPSALADLVDNSLTAAAEHISIIIDDSNSASHIAVIDNGSGMSLEKLIDAMRMGGEGPIAVRSDRDLGRFGLGLKTASMSQGRRLTVITKDSETDVHNRCWDIDFISKNQKWQLLSDLSPTAHNYKHQLEDFRTGTIVIIEKLDRQGFIKSNKNQNEHLSRAIKDTREHLGMVFHRFIKEGVEIKLGETNIRGWDPFLFGKSTKAGEERLSLNGNSIDVSSYIMPHHSSFESEDEYSLAGGPKGWTEHQGFYIYRNKRLIVPGTWLNLNIRKELHYNLARVMVDIPNSDDNYWQLNVMKSHVAAPAVLKDEFTRIASAVRTRANNVFRFRGERQIPTVAVNVVPLWKREESRSGVKYKVNRDHPAITALVKSGCEHQVILKEVIKLLEENLPIASMLQDPAKTLEGSLDPDAQDIQLLKEMFLHTVAFLVSKGKSHPEAKNMVLRSEPFIRFAEKLQQ